VNPKLIAWILEQQQGLIRDQGHYCAIHPAIAETLAPRWMRLRNQSVTMRKSPTKRKVVKST
jgi:hypothetical protein